MASWGIVPDWRGLEGSEKGSNNDHGLRDVIIFVVLHKDHRGLLTTYEPSEHNMELSTPMNHQQLSDNLNLPVYKDPSERLINLLHHQENSKLQFYPKFFGL